MANPVPRWGDYYTRKAAERAQKQEERNAKLEEEERLKKELESSNLSSVKGSHKNARGLIDLDLMFDGKTHFNPPLWDGMRVSGFYPVENRGKGWIVRDPVAKVGVGTRPDGNLNYNAYEEDPDLHDKIQTEIDTLELKKGSELTDEEKENIRSKYLRQGMEVRNSIKDWTRPYGFRFQFNPPSVSESYHTVSSVNILGMLSDLQSSIDPPVLTYTGGGMQLQLQLDRLSDVRLLWDESMKRDTIKKGYVGGIDDGDLDKIKEYGTMWDVEYLFRTVNGEPSTDLWHERITADMGFMIPYPVIISIGSKKTSRMIRGSITGFNMQHTMFSHGMIPVRTTLSLEITRHSDAWYTNDPNDSGDDFRYPEYTTVQGKPVIPDRWDRWEDTTQGTVTDGKFTPPSSFEDWRNIGDPLPVRWSGNITSKYRAARSGGPHNGVDIGCPIGTPVLSNIHGVVSFSGWNKDGYGYLVKVVEEKTKTIHFYAHMSKSGLIPNGTRVRPGDRLGLSNSTGNSTGPHLHYGVQDPRGYLPNKQWSWVDPTPWLRG